MKFLSMSNNQDFAKSIRGASIILAAVACLTLSGCRGGQVDSGCYWGPVPNKQKLEELKAKGVKTVILCRLNPMPKEQKMLEELGMNYVHIPTGLFTSPKDENISYFLSVVRNPAMRPVYICDQVARDRTQFYAGIYGMASQGWTAKQASLQMYRNGLRHWWPWFYKYKDIVKEHEQEIHAEAAFNPNSKAQ